LSALDQVKPDPSEGLLTDQAKALLQSGDPAAATDRVMQRLTDHPNDPEALYVLAVCQRFQSKSSEALETLDRLLVAKPGFGRAFQEQGYCFRSLGRMDDAFIAFKRAVAGNLALIASWKLVADLNAKAGRLQEADMAQAQFEWLSSLPRELVSVLSFLHEGKVYKSEQLCRSYLQTHGHDVEAMRLLAELGTRFHALDDAEFLLESCIALRPDYLMGRYDYVRVLNRRQKFEQAVAEAKALWQLAPDNPHFQLLLGHQYMAIGDFDAALAIYEAMSLALPNDANIGLMRGHALKAFGEAFMRDTAIHRKSGTPFFIDKMPNNFRHIGLIHLILPNAKIIDARRDAMACCFSGFKQLFAEGQEFTYGLEEVGRYYRDYVDLMDHWDRVLPGKVLRVQYESVVADLDTQVRRILDYCGLDFEESCVNFHQNNRAVRTASSEQVRQPIFTSGLDQWENFSPYLNPLRDVLGHQLVSI
jgi:tetratricopeptide (TPR) repeat protein